MSRRWLAIDYGTVRTGVAISDPLGVVARGLVTIPSRQRSLSELANDIAEIVDRENVTDILLGLPKRTDGKKGDKEEVVQELAEAITIATDIRPILVDERYTTVIASQYAKELKVRGNRKRQVIDQMAAEVMLQEYLNYLARGNYGKS